MLNSFLKSALLLILLLAGCKIDREKPVDRAKFNFEIGDDSELFFRNVRQIYYDRSSPDGKWQAYRFKDFYEGNDRPLIVPVIVINWLKDEAYLLIDTNELLGAEDSLSVIITNALTHRSDTVVLDQRGRENMLEFASSLYEAIQKNEDMNVKWKGEYVPLLHEQADRESFRITLADYYRLIRVF